MKIKTSELIRPHLDWAVSKCEGASEWLLLVEYKELYQCGKLNKYSTDWACGGPIMERLLEEGMLLEWCDPAYKKLEKFKASMNGWKTTYRGNTPLIAAMRCYVASKLGDVVDIPDEMFLPGYHDLPQGTKLYAIPEGWTLVPNEPTPAMKKAGSLARHSAACDGGYAIVGGPAAESCYRAMLDASPNV